MTGADRSVSFGIRITTVSVRRNCEKFYSQNLVKKSDSQIVRFPFPLRVRLMRAGLGQFFLYGVCQTDIFEPGFAARFVLTESLYRNPSRSRSTYWFVWFVLSGFFIERKPSFICALSRVSALFLMPLLLFFHSA